MTRRTYRFLSCDVDGCDEAFSVQAKQDWFVVQARARTAGWRQSGNRHRCPAHRYHPLPSLETVDAEEKSHG